MSSSYIPPHRRRALECTGSAQKELSPNPTEGYSLELIAAGFGHSFSDDLGSTQPDTDGLQSVNSSIGKNGAVNKAIAFVLIFNDCDHAWEQDKEVKCKATTSLLRHLSTRATSQMEPEKERVPYLGYSQSDSDSDDECPTPKDENFGCPSLWNRLHRQSDSIPVFRQINGNVDTPRFIFDGWYYIESSTILPFDLREPRIVSADEPVT